MEIFVLALGLLALLLLGPAALFLVLRLRQALGLVREREQVLEKRLEVLERAVGVRPPPVVEAPVAPRGHADPLPSVQEGRRAGIDRKLSASGLKDLESLVGGQWLTWLGILAIFFGTAFFLGYDLSGPLAGSGQILVGLGVGALFILAGRGLARRAGRFLARGLLGGGVALFYVTAYAAYGFHHLVPAVVVFPFLGGAALVGGALALLENSLTVASLALVGALLTPLLLAGGRTPPGLCFRTSSP